MKVLLIRRKICFYQYLIRIAAQILQVTVCCILWTPNLGYRKMLGKNQVDRVTNEEREVLKMMKEKVSGELKGEDKMVGAVLDGIPRNW